MFRRHKPSVFTLLVFTILMILIPQAIAPLPEVPGLYIGNFKNIQIFLRCGPRTVPRTPSATTPSARPGDTSFQES